MSTFPNGYDDTDDLDRLFRILAKPKFDDINRMLLEYRLEYQNKHNGEYPSTENVRFMKEHGWSWPEYLREKYHRNSQ